MSQVHFGASYIKATLHSGVIYTSTGTAQAFCLILSSNVHEALSVWAHLTPELRNILELNPDIDTFHLLSYGLSSH